MKHRMLLLAGLLTAALPVTTACDQTSEALGEASSDSARVEPVKGGELSHVILTPPAYERLGIRTETVVHRATGRKAKASAGVVIPAAAVMYDAEGRSWAYTSDGELSYVRLAVTVDHFEGGLAYLEDDLATGTSLVTTGVPELFGIEQGVDGE